jgi:hypothetical protein
MASKKRDGVVAEGLDAPGSLTGTVANFEINRLGGGTEALFLIGGDSVRTRHELAPGRVTIGRSDQVDISINSTGISRRHAIIEISDSGAQLIDVGSRNGTFLNGRRIKRARIQHGDVIYFGPGVRFVVEAARTAEAEPQFEESPTPVPAWAAPTKTAPPTDDDFVQTLESERRQLAILLQVALRYLGRGTQSPDGVLFDILDRIVAFDAAFISSADGTFLIHPSGARLSDRDCAALVASAQPGSSVVLDTPGDATTVGGMRIGSRAFLPIGDGFLVLLAKADGAYTGQRDFLLLVGRLHAAASGR